MLRFRNYKPQSDALQGLDVEKPAIPKVEDHVDTATVVHNDATQEPLLNLDICFLLLLKPRVILYSLSNIRNS